jgi:hypothetical protein
MTGTPRSLFLSVANRTAGWWMGHAANAVRRGQAAVKARGKPVVPKRRVGRRTKG